ncbi:MAG: VOC family protein [Anaerolineales bacterium]|nr:VOC family protein [Anaerolineales bacterium]
MTFKTTNTILYCQKWAETVAFYQEKLALPVLFASDWFVEFELGPTARLSVADERRSKVKSCGGIGITLTLQVENTDAAWAALLARGLELEPLQDHAWGARLFYFYDPEGHRLEIWSPVEKKEKPAGKGGYLPV